MIKKILVAYDNGEKAKKALETAVEIAKGCQAEICLMTSVNIPEFISSVAYPDMSRDLEKQTRNFFEDIHKEVEAKVAEEGIPVSTVILNENPGEAIVRYSEQEKYDLIVIGSANRGTIERVLLGLGSVSNYVLQRAKCPVLLIKE